jgi:exopolysaccharide biosynthesis polyprenyl glycosylphosphotransferase
LCTGVQPYRPLALVAAGLLAAQLLLSRPDRTREGPGYVEEVLRAFREATITAVGVVVFAFFWRPGAIPHLFSYSRATLALDWLMIFLLLSLLRIGIKSILIVLRRRGHNIVLVAVVGKSPSARSFIETLDAQRQTGYRIVAHMDTSEPGDGLVSALATLASTQPLAEVILATRSLGREEISRLLSRPEMNKTKFRAVPELFGLPPAKVQITPVLGDFPLLSLFTEPLRGPRRSIKRAVDVILSIMGLILTSPILVLSAVSVRLSSPGPILFRQERIGMDGRRFEMLKIRSMYDGSDPTSHREYVTSMLSGETSAAALDGNLYKLAGDPRITPVGRLMRRLSIDELPQLVNVLRGDMSIVGPRPALAFEVKLYEEWQHHRLRVRPGITGLWQVSGRSRLTTSDMLRLDVSYAEAWSLVLDLVILLKTPLAVLRRDAG